MIIQGGKEKRKIKNLNHSVQRHALTIMSMAAMCFHSMKGLVYIAVYVDDNLMIGSPDATDEAMKQLKRKRLVVKVMESLQDYLLCEIWFSEDEKKVWLGQPFLIVSLEKKLSKEL